MTISFSDTYEHREFVENIANEWRKGAKTFSVKSSGTTGIVKEIELDRALLEWSANRTAETFNLENEKILCCMPVDKTAGFMQLIRALHHDWDIHFEQPSSTPLAALSENHTYTLVSMSPQQISHCLDYNSKQLSKFNTVLIGGVALTRDLELDLIRWNEDFRFCELIVTYGSAETASHIGYRKLGDRFYSCIEGVQLTLKADCLCAEIEELDFKHCSSDLAEITNQGFRILGRSDEVINSGGIKINLRQTQALVREIFQLAGINRNIYLSSSPDRELGQKLVLVVEGQPIKDEYYLLQLLKRELPQHHSPRELTYREKFEYTDTGKLKRSVYTQ